jgi:hypothetical protein
VNFLSRDQLSAMLQQHHEDLKRLVRKTKLDTLAAKLTRAQIRLEFSEGDEP